MVSQQELQELFAYDCGKLYWKKSLSNRAPIGKEVAPCKTRGGYLRVSVNKKTYPVHKLIYVLHHGDWPKFIDHINGVRDDNRIENLRTATANENARNCKIPKSNSSGFKGVCFDNTRKLWIAHITVENKYKFLGYFADIEDAKSVRFEAEKRIFKEFARNEYVY